MHELHFIDIRDFIENHERFYAHSSNTKECETLFEHLELTKKYLLLFFDKKGIGILLEKMIQGIRCENMPLSQEYIDLIWDMFINAVYLHDTGKINPAFQKLKMKNPYFKSADFFNSEHALISALIYVDLFEQRVKCIEDDSLRLFLYNILYSFAYQISRHHTYLKNLTDFIDELNKIRNHKYLSSYISTSIFELRLDKDDSPFHLRFMQYEYWNMNSMEFYILNKLLYSLIVGCDFCATYEYYNSKPVELNRIESPEELLSQFKQYKVIQGIEEYKKDPINTFSKTPINALRSELFIEAESNLLKQINENIFFLEAPTGSGKTIMSINLALNIINHCREYKKIFYIFPFNTLVEQTRQTFEEIFGANAPFTIINSLTPIEAIGGQDEEIDYETSLIARQFLNYPIIFTTHVNLFNYLFGTNREANLPLTQICNSVVILDEIQSYRNSLWKEISMFLHQYAGLLNIKVIIMSATLPKLDQLIPQDHEAIKFASLVENPQKYYLNNLFKERVKLNFDLIDDSDFSLVKLRDTVSSVVKAWNRPAKILIEFIKKDTARDFFNLIKTNFPNVLELTGDDNKYTRDKAIEFIKNANDVIVVSTQVIEAGVNIDMDIGFKDISLLDSEEQFLGRINRSCLKEGCIAYFFCLDNTKDIYQDDFRTIMDLKSPKYREYLQNKDFSQFYLECMRGIEERKAQYNEYNIQNLLSHALKLDFDKVSDWMKLIDQKNFQLFIPRIVETGDQPIDGYQLWEHYKRLCQNMELGYAEKMFSLSALNEQMSYFTYSLACYDRKINAPPYFTELFGNYFYIADGEKYIEDGKFNRKKYLKDTKGLFL
jgi:CRISPR-associated endonuclease/helicase Cas3